MKEYLREYQILSSQADSNLSNILTDRRERIWNFLQEKQKLTVLARKLEALNFSDYLAINSINEKGRMLVNYNLAREPENQMIYRALFETAKEYSKFMEDNHKYCPNRKGYMEDLENDTIVDEVFEGK